MHKFFFNSRYLHAFMFRLFRSSLQIIANVVFDTNVTLISSVKNLRRGGLGMCVCAGVAGLGERGRGNHNIEENIKQNHGRLIPF